MAAAGRKRKDGHLRPPPPHQSHVPPLLLAASAIEGAGGGRPLSYTNAVIKRCLKSHLALLNRRHPPPLAEALPSILLALLPTILRSRDAKLAAISAEVVGAAALSSLEANEAIVAEADVVECLATALRSRSARVVEAVASSILDLSSSSIGRVRLCGSSALVELIGRFNESFSSFVCSDALIRNEVVDIIDNEHLVVLLDAMITLINACSLDQLENIPQEMASCFLIHLREFWVSIRDSTLSSKSTKCYQERWRQLRHFEAVEVAESLFRLSICHTNVITCSFDEVMDGIFGSTEFDFQHFISNYWEESPVVLRQGVSGSLCKNDNDILNKFAGCFRSKNIDLVLDCILGGLVSCPPLVSDELDIGAFLKETKGGLGIPIVYGQDIRVVRTMELTSGPTNESRKLEMHFFGDCVAPADVCIEKLKESYAKGFTIALRGMEFRSHMVASFANSLAILFGQPAVGANLYLTPPGAQGLTCHYDDHCVFIFQLVGHKRWTTFPGRKILLPRLYEPLQSVLSLDDIRHQRDCKEYLLKEGDILYIPRGCPHEAHTISCANDSFSLHLTLSIEVEPPFEWEGFTHVALHCWSQNLRHKPFHSTQVTFDGSDGLLATLLHVSIKLIADRNAYFRKACMVGSFLYPLDIGGAVHISDENLKNRETFGHVIHTINSNAEFNEALSNLVTATSEKNKEPLQWMSWLRHLYPEDEAEEMGVKYSHEAFDKAILVCGDRLSEVETAFVQMKAAFCRGVSYSDACKSFHTLLLKYRNSRGKYMNGMLSLHSM